jgi:hypothetical protein
MKLGICDCHPDYSIKTEDLSKQTGLDVSKITIMRNDLEVIYMTGNIDELIDFFEFLNCKSHGINNET